MSVKRVVLATHNQHKVDEFQAIVASVRPDLTIVAYDGPEPVEDGVTFAQNALIKARTAAAHTGLPALADDSGICIDALGGAPGVFSAYWAGHAKDAVANRRLLLDQLSDVTNLDLRAGQFLSVIALALPSGEEHTVEGVWPGHLALAETGENGFGYDPVFVPDVGGQRGTRSAAELSPEEKNAESHRARAFKRLTPLLSQL